MAVGSGQTGRHVQHFLRRGCPESYRRPTCKWRYFTATKPVFSILVKIKISNCTLFRKHVFVWKCTSTLMKDRSLLLFYFYFIIFYYFLKDTGFWPFIVFWRNHQSLRLKLRLVLNTGPDIEKPYGDSYYLYNCWYILKDTLLLPYQNPCEIARLWGGPCNPCLFIPITMAAGQSNSCMS